MPRFSTPGKPAGPGILHHGTRPAPSLLRGPRRHPRMALSSSGRLAGKRCEDTLRMWPFHANLLYVKPLRQNSGGKERKSSENYGKVRKDSRSLGTLRHVFLTQRRRDLLSLGTWLTRARCFFTTCGIRRVGKTPSRGRLGYIPSPLRRLREKNRLSDFLLAVYSLTCERASHRPFRC